MWLPKMIEIYYSIRAFFCISIHMYRHVYIYLYMWFLIANSRSIFIAKMYQAHNAWVGVCVWWLLTWCVCKLSATGETKRCLNPIYGRERITKRDRAIVIQHVRRVSVYFLWRLLYSVIIMIFLKFSGIYWQH